MRRATRPAYPLPRPGHVCGAGCCCLPHRPGRGTHVVDLPPRGGGGGRSRHVLSPRRLELERRHLHSSAEAASIDRGVARRARPITRRALEASSPWQRGGFEALPDELPHRERGRVGCLAARDVSLSVGRSEGGRELLWAVKRATPAVAPTTADVATTLFATRTSRCPSFRRRPRVF